jgi:hypothetical protein
LLIGDFLQTEVNFLQKLKALPVKSQLMINSAFSYEKNVIEKTLHIISLLS